MSEKLNSNEYTELVQIFGDLLNYDANDPTEPIDPLTYHEPGGDNCLHVAASRGNYKAVELLLKAGIDVNSAGEMGCTALHYANQYEHDEVAELLIRNGASIDILNEFGKRP